MAGRSSRLRQQYNAGLRYLKAGKLESAIGKFVAALQTQPDDSDTLLALAEAFFRADNTEEAVNTLRHATRVAPGATVWFHLGIGLREAGLLEEAEAAYHQSLQFEPNAPDVHYSLANVLRQREQPEEAIEEYRTALRLNPGFADAMNNCALAYQDLQRYAEAVDHLRACVELDPDDLVFRWNLADTLCGMSEETRECGFRAEALELYRSVLAAEPDNANGWYTLGQELHNAELYEGAVAAFSYAVRLAPDDWEAWDNMGIALDELGRLEEALIAFCEAESLSPDSPAPKNNRGITLGHLGRVDEAIAALEAAIPGNPSAWRPFINLLELLEEQHRFTEAVEVGKRALEAFPDDGYLQYLTGVALAETGDIPRALTHFRVAAELADEEITRTAAQDAIRKYSPQL
jgi:tetratricopeptide (TPR) repeat protein